MKRYFGYVRVSDPRQGKGVSLDEQRSAILAHAAKQGYEVIEWFQELETAAAKGRTVFNTMLRRLERGEAEGVAIHKIDRGARNLEDWSKLGRLSERGFDIQFAHDNIDLHTRGGRLSADIIAVVAADYIRNLREEVKKGFYGRLKQGVYPLPAPLGYVNKGAGNPKEIDPHSGPLVLEMFETYASGRISLRELQDTFQTAGLTSRRGARLSRSGLAKLLRNPFYIGLIHINKTNETFQGAHEPLVPKELFDRVQVAMDVKIAAKLRQHSFMFKRFIRCRRCDRVLTGELQKGKYVYYRCHGERCRDTRIRGADVEHAAKRLVESLRLAPDEIQDLRDLVDLEAGNEEALVAEHKKTLTLHHQACEARLTRLTDALLDGNLDNEEFNGRRAKLLRERQGLRGQLEGIGRNSPLRDAFKMFELTESQILGYETFADAEKRELLKIVSSNWRADRENLTFTLHSPYREMLDEPDPAYCGPHRARIRTFAVFEALKRLADPDTKSLKSSRQLEGEHVRA